MKQKRAIIFLNGKNNKIKTTSWLFYSLLSAASEGAFILRNK